MLTPNACCLFRKCGPTPLCSEGLQGTTPTAGAHHPELVPPPAMRQALNPSGSCFSTIFPGPSPRVDISHTGRGLRPLLFSRNPRADTSDLHCPGLYHEQLSQRLPLTRIN